jgi:fluoroquinolone resistance protein
MGDCVANSNLLTLEILERAADEGTTLKGYDLATFEWTEAEVLDLKLEDCLAQGVEFRSCDLEGLEAVDCQFVDCTFVSTSLKEADFKRCTFTNKDEHKGTEFRYANLENSKFSECDLSFSTFDRCDLYDLGLKACRCRALDFSSSSFSRVLSRTRSLTRFEAEETNLESSSFFGLELETVKFQKCSLRLATFEEAKLSSALLLDCNLNETEFRGADLSGANLGGSNLAGFDLRTLKSYEDLMVSESQGTILLIEMGLTVI